MEYLHSYQLPASGENNGAKTHKKILHTASDMPNMLLVVICWPVVIQPSTMIEQVLKCPATVLLTGPAPIVT